MNLLDRTPLYRFAFVKFHKITNEMQTSRNNLNLFQNILHIKDKVTLHLEAYTCGSLKGPIVYSLLGGGGVSELGDCLGSLRDGVFGEFSGEEEPDSGLDLTGGDGRLLVVVGKTGGLGSDPLEDVVNEGVHDRHGLGGHADVGVNLLEHLVDVDTIRLLPLRLPLLLISLDHIL